jgi:hypothetical protein
MGAGEEVTWLARSQVRRIELCVMGGVADVLGLDQRPRFQSYVVERH